MLIPTIAMFICHVKLFFERATRKRTTLAAEILRVTVARQPIPRQNLANHHVERQFSASGTDPDQLQRVLGAMADLRRLGADIEMACALTDAIHVGRD